jgi:hypothetical protein
MPDVHDPRASVVEPVHRALEFLVLRGAASFAVAVLAVLVSVVRLEEPLREIGQLALPAVLAFVAAARLAHVVIRRPGPADAAWTRAHAIDRRETEFAAIVAVAVPLAWLVGGGAVLAHRASDQAGLAEVVGVWLPLGGGLWALATIAWAGDCRERLAVALAESERRFRSYWQSVGRSS